TTFELALHPSEFVAFLDSLEKVKALTFSLGGTNLEELHPWSSCP
ncbi:hypothetical protein Tco_0607268, partial [Tanacetum coccineum]